MQRSIIAMAAMLVLAMPPGAGAQSNPCASIVNDIDRLACYDAAANRRSAPAAKTTNSDRPESAWNMIKDQLSDKIISAETKSSTEFIQTMPGASQGESVSASLIVSCGVTAFEPGTRRIRNSTLGPGLYANVWFSRPVVEGFQQQGRVRIDERSVQAIEPNAYSKETIELYFPGHFLMDAMAPLFGSKRLRVEYNLSFAGKVILEFPTSGAKEAFSKITCPE
jgi:hypothetical protein